MEQSGRAEKKLLGSQIEEKILEYILEQPVKIGEKIPNEFELAEMFGVGRSTIREAVKGLVTKGVLEVRRGSGTYVCNTSTVEEDPLGLAKLRDRYKLALELLDVRLMMEPEIAARAAEFADEEEIEELRRLCDETERLYLAGEDHMAKDMEYHACIAKCSKNRVVESLIPIINSAITTFVNLTYRKLRAETLSTHRAVLNAIAEHDTVGARCAMIMHLTYNRQALMELWKKHGEQE